MIPSLSLPLLPLWLPPGFVVDLQDSVRTPPWVALTTTLQIYGLYFLCYSHRGKTEAEAFDTAGLGWCL